MAFQSGLVPVEVKDLRSLSWRQNWEPEDFFAHPGFAPLEHTNYNGNLDVLNIEEDLFDEVGWLSNPD